MGNHWFARLVRHVAPQNAHVYRQAELPVAVRDLLDALDADADGRIASGEARAVRLRLLGYSWGGASALQLADFLGGEEVTVPLPDGPRTWRLAAPIPVTVLLVIDPISLGRPLPPPDDHVQRFLNYYQTRGGNAILRSVDGRIVEQVGAVLSRRLRGDPVTRIEPEPGDVVVDVARDHEWRGRPSIPDAGRLVYGGETNHDTIPWFVYPLAAKKLAE